MFYLKLLRFKYRKFVHFSLLTSIVVMQVLLIIILYNETINESKLKKIEKSLNFTSKARDINELTRGDFISVKKDLHKYMISNDGDFLNKYYSDLKKMRYHLDSLSKFSKSNTQFLNYLKPYYSENLSQDNLNKKMDSLKNINVLSNKKIRENLLMLRSFEYRDVLKSIKIDSSFTVDSVGRKKLFARLFDAFQDKTNVEKQKKNLILTMKYGNVVSSGTIEEQIAEVFKKNNEFYQKQFLGYQKEILDLKNNNFEFINAYETLLVNTESLLDEYNRSLDLLEERVKSDFKRQNNLNKSIRNYSLIGIVLLMVVISIILIYFTRLSFMYEKRLEIIQERIEKNLSFKNRIVSMISHEIRSPLNIISLYCSGIIKQLKDEGLIDSLKSIQFTTNSLSLLANQILKFSKNEEKSMKFNEAHFGLEEELTLILKALKCLVEGSGNAFELSMNVSEDVLVYSDAIKIHELFYNIIGNANKFTNEGNIYVSVECFEDGMDRYNLKVKIKDNGVGISEEDLKNIFEAYYEGEISSKVQNLGVGLGLNLCRELIELFNGDIKVESELNKGTLVSFNIFLKKHNENSNLSMLTG